MHNAMVCAFEYMGCASLLTMSHASYPALTAEFLTTLGHDIKNAGKEGTITFQLGNVERTMSLRQWNQIFGFSTPAPKDYDHKRVPLLKMWRRISGQQDYNTKRARLHTEIASPLFRLILRVLGNTVYARKENSKPSDRELYFLFKALHNSGESLNVGWELLTHLMQYKGFAGELQVGGMIAHIATRFDIDLS